VSAGESPEAAKPYPDNVWWVKRLGIAAAGVLVAAGVAGGADALDAPYAVVVGFFLSAVAVDFVVYAWWMAEWWRREKRRQVAVRTLGGEPASPPADRPAEPPSARRRVWLIRMALAVIAVAGIPLTVIGVSAHVAAVRDLGLGLIAIQVIVMAIILPGLSVAGSRARARSGRPTDAPRLP
jgi:hypothetical protein